ncbi:hypothetical protein HRbin36_02423 [bacterium HR36]|nr:hypothetical protein HRbin36_02423 [bacterium HR36]
MANGRAASLFHAEGRLRQECFSLPALRALRAAVDAAIRTCWPSIRSPHLFIGLLEEADEPIAQWLERNQLQASQLRQTFLELFDMSHELTPPQLQLHRSYFSEHLLQILEQAQQRAQQRGDALVTTADLLATVLTSEPSVIAECLRREGYDVAPLRESVQNL